jgi:nicotinamide-nucleotide amidase
LGKLIDSDIHVAVTGLISPGGSETPEKPVGTMFIHIKLPHKYVHHREVFDGRPDQVISKSVDRMAELVIDNL